MDPVAFGYPRQGRVRRPERRNEMAAQVYNTSTGGQREKEQQQYASTHCKMDRMEDP